MPIKQKPNPLPLALAFLGIALALLSAINLTGHAQPTLALNEKVIADLGAIGRVPVGEQMQALAQLRDEQEKALSTMPAEPFAWARYSYLRLATQGDKNAAFAALRMSDWVSPEEPRQLPERAIMWRQLGAAENPDQVAYQTTLWQKAFRLQPDQTWKIPKQTGLTDDIGAAIQKGDPEQYEEWKARMNQ